MLGVSCYRYYWTNEREIGLNPRKLQPFIALSSVMIPTVLVALIRVWSSLAFAYVMLTPLSVIVVLTWTRFVYVCFRNQTTPIRTHEIISDRDSECSRFVEEGEDIVLFSADT